MKNGVAGNPASSGPSFGSQEALGQDAFGVPRLDCDSETRLNRVLSGYVFEPRASVLTEKSVILATTPLGEAWRSAIIASLHQTTDHLSSNPLSAENVHKARRELKRVTALLHLAPPHLAPLAAISRKAARRMHRMLAEAREATALRNALSRLEPNMPRAARRIEACLPYPHAFAPEQKELESACAHLLLCAHKWAAMSDPISANDLIESVTRNYRKGRNAAEPALIGTPKQQHDWRDEVVLLHQHLVFIAPKALSELRHLANELREFLGDCNDLDQLMSFVRTSLDIKDADQFKLERAAKKRHARLLGFAEKTSTKLFEQRPRDFRHILIKLENVR